LVPPMPQGGHFHIIADARAAFERLVKGLIE
jgi:hypothetical protein